MVNCAQVGRRGLFNRYAGNPILTATQWPYPAHTVFNPGAVEVDGETVLLNRVEDLRGFSHLTVARSENGRSHWEIDSSPTFTHSKDEEQWGLEDPRIVWLEDYQKYAVTYVSFSPSGPQVSLGMTEDFRSLERLGAVLPPEDKDACLFPRSFEDKFVLIHRPIVRGEPHIWLSTSPDLIHWGNHKILIPRRGGWWDNARVGLGTQPIETSEGWLIIYHGARDTASGSLYRVGLALLDLEEPWRLMRRSEEWVFGPHEEYEFLGDVPGVVFPSGAILDEETGELRVYYGAADTSVGLAMADIDEVLDYLKNCPDS